MTEKVNSTHKIEEIKEIKEIKETIKQINDFNNNFYTWVKSELLEILQGFDKSLVLDEMIILLGSIKEEYFDGGERQKKALIDSLASKKQTLQEEIKLRQ